MGGWVCGSNENITNSAPNLVGLGAELGNDQVASTTRRDMIFNCNSADDCSFVKDVADVNSSLGEPSKKRIRFDKGSMNSSPNV